MSRLATGTLTAFALSLALGAAQLASGRDLSEALPDHLPTSLTQRLTVGANAVTANAVSPGTDAVNRAAKADRAATVAGSAGQTRTVALRLDGFSDTSFLVRVPVANATGAPSPAPPTTKSKNRNKMTLACEPVVSVLTEVAKLLQPGRCVT